MLTQEKRTIQVCSESTPKIWDRVTTKANIGDTIHAPYTPVMQVIGKDTYTNGQVWLLVKPVSASYYTEEWVLKKEEDDLPLLPQTEFEQGVQHGQLDAAEKLPPIYTETSCEYSTGYVKGYNPTPVTKTVTPPRTWSVTYNQTWQWYVVWVGDRAIGRAFDCEEAERIGQKYIAGEKVWQKHRERVLASYSD